MMTRVAFVVEGTSGSLADPKLRCIKLSDREKVLVTESGGVLFMRFIVTYNICVSVSAAFWEAETFMEY